MSTTQAIAEEPRAREYETIYILRTTVNPDEAEMVRELFALYLDRRSLLEVVKGELPRLAAQVVADTGGCQSHRHALRRSISGLGWEGRSAKDRRDSSRRRDANGKTHAA